MSQSNLLVRSTVYLGLLGLLSACSSAPQPPPDPPYVLQRGCEFTLVVSEQNSTSTTVEKGNTMITMRLSMGDHQISISDCQVVENPAQLPIHVE